MGRGPRMEWSPSLPAVLQALEARRLLSVPTGFSDSTLLSNLDHPTAMAVAPDGRVFVTEQHGWVRVIKNGQLLSSPFVSLPTHINGSQGLLNVAIDPNFASNHYVYAYYTVFPSTSTARNRLSRFTASGDGAVAGSEKVLIETDNLTSTQHPGGAIGFGADGKLYLAVGDNYTASNAQSKSNVFGKVLRLNTDGSIPTDNPFYATT